VPGFFWGSQPAPRSANQTTFGVFERAGPVRDAMAGTDESAIRNQYETSQATWTFGSEGSTTDPRRTPNRAWACFVETGSESASAMSGALATVTRLREATPRGLSILLQEKSSGRRAANVFGESVSSARRSVVGLDERGATHSDADCRADRHPIPDERLPPRQKSRPRVEVVTETPSLWHYLRIHDG
jgi:hypothetical protein